MFTLLAIIGALAVFVALLFGIAKLLQIFHDGAKRSRKNRKNKAQIVPYSDEPQSNEPNRE